LDTVPIISIEVPLNMWSLDNLLSIATHSDSEIGKGMMEGIVVRTSEYGRNDFVGRNSFKVVTE